MSKAKREARKIVEAAEWDLSGEPKEVSILTVSTAVAFELMSYGLFKSLDRMDERYYSNNPGIIGMVGHFLIEVGYVED